ncbi:MAG: amidophosphoribosyltransferase [Deltaproteobacteria bacterium]|nr:amidophosphoribosyltransferase [Deltaproteobacteria bacterium]
MSEPIKHECGIALLRLKKPLSYYLNQYNTSFYGLHKLYLLMEKQHNRGQDGAGIANIKFDMPPGHRYISRTRSNHTSPLQEIFGKINQQFDPLTSEQLKDLDALKKNHSFTGELFLGHLRYGTFGKNTIESCHPFLRQNNWKTRNLVIAGNFNLTNVSELFANLTNLGQHPKEMSDTVTVLENIGHFLDQENERLFQHYKQENFTHPEISEHIARNLNIQTILQRSAAKWDGGYAMAGLLGHGDAFVLRDPAGIRPAFYYEDEEVAVVTSERPPIQTAFNVSYKDIHEIPPGHAFIIKKSGKSSLVPFKSTLPKKSCSFERIYFSRGTDRDIYLERKNLGQNVLPQVLASIDHDVENTVFSFIPNTAETSFLGLIEALRLHLDTFRMEEIIKAQGDPAKIAQALALHPRVEKIAVKDTKLRTFISEDSGRDEIVAHIYDVTYGVVRNGIDNLVVVDDSIVRGTTLKKSILRILGRLQPKKISIVSSAPQIRYPDCYGIDMARIGDFIAFQAAIALLKERGQQQIIDDVYQACLAQQTKPKDQIENHVKKIYAPFSDEEINQKISSMLTPEQSPCPIDIIYQSVEGLHKAIPEHKGDWYFTGDYPTPGGMRVVNQAFINYIEGHTGRAYA